LLQFYDAYYFWKDGSSPFYDFFGALLKLQTVKGGLTQDAGFLISILLGPNRLSLWLPNFGALILFLAFVYDYASRVMSKEASLVITTLMLLGPAVYADVGGLNDLRWDFVGIMMFGCFMFCLLKLINRNTRTNMALAIVLSLIAIDVRSINMAFVGLTIFGVTLVFLLLSTSKSLRSYALPQVKTMMILGTIVLIFYAVFALIHWAEINSYYLERLQSGEKLIRMKEFGAEDGILKYYIQGTFELYKPYVGYYLFVFATLWIYWWATRRLLSHPDSASVTTGVEGINLRWRLEGVLIACVAMVSVLWSASLYAGIPIVPCYLLGVLGCLMVCSGPPIEQKDGSAFLWIVLLILFSFALIRVSSMQSWGKSELKSQSNALQLFQTVLSSNPGGGRIFFSVVDEAMLPEAFMIWLYENGSRSAKEKFSGSWLEVLPLSPTQYDAQLSEADIVFRWDKAPPTATFPSEEQVNGEFGRTSWGRISPQFVRLTNVPYKAGIMGVYARRIRATDIFVPFGIEGKRWFWLGDEHARISIVNSAATVLPVKVSATLGLGPSVPPGSQVKLCVVSGTAVLDCYPVTSNKYDFEIVVPVVPGGNELELAVVHDDGMTFSPLPGDPRHLLLNVSGLRISEAGS